MYPFFTKKIVNDEGFGEGVAVLCAIAPADSFRDKRSLAFVKISKKDELLPENNVLDGLAGTADSIHFMKRSECPGALPGLRLPQDFFDMAGMPWLLFRFFGLPCGASQD